MSSNSILSKKKFEFLKHEELVGKHAFLGASKSSWLNYDLDDELRAKYLNQYATSIGTGLHYVASDYIRTGTKLRKGDMRFVAKDLQLAMEYGLIPKFPISACDLPNKFENLANFVNDAIGFGMKSEQPLQYSENCFGTADAISFNDGMLRIHDYKSGTTPAHIEQLHIYAALFCLEYKIPVSDIQIETRIYQLNEILYSLPAADEIGPIMDKIVTLDKRIKSFRIEVN